LNAAVMFPSRGGQGQCLKDHRHDTAGINADIRLLHAGQALEFRLDPGRFPASERSRQSATPGQLPARGQWIDPDHFRAERPERLGRQITDHPEPEHENHGLVLGAIRHDHRGRRHARQPRGRRHTRLHAIGYRHHECVLPALEMRDMGAQAEHTLPLRHPRHRRPHRLDDTHIGIAGPPWIGAPRTLLQG
jgi:hypothetical protein